MLSNSLIQYSVDGWSCIPSLLFIWGQTMASLVAQRFKHLLAMRETQVRFLGQEDPLEKEMATHSSIPAMRVSFVHESLQAGILEWVLCPPPGDLLDPEIESASLRSPALAGEFFTISTTGKPKSWA